MSFDLYLTTAWLGLYDNDGDAGDAGDAGAGDAGDAGDAGAGAGGSVPINAGAAGAAGGTGGKVFSQEDLNRIVQERLAKDRKAQEQKYRELEAEYKTLLENQSLTSDQRAKLESELEDIQKRFRTKEQQLAHEKAQMEERLSGELETYKTAAVEWENKYKTSVTDRALIDAATTGDAFNAQQVVALLRPMTKMVEAKGPDGQPTGHLIPMLDFPDVNEAGEPVMTQRTPDEAVKRMKEIPEQYGNLFKSNVVSGIGAGSATGGVTPGSAGRIDVKKLSPEQYMKLRKENPNLLGLRPER